MGRLTNKAIALLTSRFPSLAKRIASSYQPLSFAHVPWTPFVKPLHDSLVAVVTTAGVHHRDHAPFRMTDPDGDPSWRSIDGSRPLSSLMITHDYYDHTDADRDMNIVFPIERLRELATEGRIGAVADFHFGFMGHITGPHIPTLTGKTAPEVATALREQKVDVVLLTPG